MSKADQDFATRWFEEIWDRQRRQAIGEMLAPEAGHLRRREECTWHRGILSVL